MIKLSQTCYKCRETKLAVYFYKDRFRSSGLSSSCKKCRIRTSTEKQLRREKGPSGYSSRYYHKHIERYRNHNIRARNNKRDIINAAKNKPCIVCGTEYHPCQMDLDHRDPKTKLATISQMIKSGYSVLELENEIAKCDVICSNCHRLKTYKTQVIRNPLTKIV